MTLGFGGGYFEMVLCVCVCVHSHTFDILWKFCLQTCAQFHDFASGHTLFEFRMVMQPSNPPSSRSFDDPAFGRRMA